MIIFMDIDGVLRDIVAAGCEHYGLDEWPKGIYNPAVAVDYTNFFKALPDSVWLDAAPYNHANKLLNICCMRYTTVICSSSPPDVTIPWVEKTFPWYDGEYVFTENKALLAGKDRLLIDDYTNNCDQWAAAGGLYLLWPSIGNSLVGNGFTALEEMLC